MVLVSVYSVGRPSARSIYSLWSILYYLGHSKTERALDLFLPKSPSHLLEKETRETGREVGRINSRRGKERERFGPLPLILPLALDRGLSARLDHCLEAIEPDLSVDRG